MKPASLALAGAAALSTVFAAVETASFAALLAVPTLAASVGNAHANGTLYRWKEPDGSLTFSPTAPTDGTPYEVVDPMTMRPVDASGGTRDGGSGVARIERSAAAPAGERAPSFTDPLPTAAASGAAESAAPALGAAGRRFPEPIVRTRPVAPAARTATAAGGRDAGRPDTVANRASSDRERRCSELEKRVVSLERRLSTPLTPEAMDNTVVQMARYQQSADRHCR